METDVQIKSDLVCSGQRDEIDMRSINGHVQQDRDARLGLLVPIPVIESVKLPNYYYAPREGLNFLRIKNPDACYLTKGKYKGNNNITHYYIFDGILDRADKRIVTVPQELKFQFSEKLVFSSYSYRLYKLKQISPYIANLIHVVIYIVNKRSCVVKIVGKDNYFKLLEMTSKEVLTTIFPEVKRILKKQRTTTKINNTPISKNLG